MKGKEVEMLGDKSRKERIDEILDKCPWYRNVGEQKEKVVDELFVYKIFGFRKPTEYISSWRKDPWLPSGYSKARKVKNILIEEGWNRKSLSISTDQPWAEKSGFEGLTLLEFLDELERIQK